MKVVTSPGILNLLRGKIVAAKRNGDRIEHIILTEQEFRELSNHVDFTLGMLRFATSPTRRTCFKTITLTAPPPIGHHEGSHRTFATQYEFEGYDLFVVPQEYHPRN